MGLTVRTRESVTRRLPALLCELNAIFRIPSPTHPLHTIEKRLGSEIPGPQEETWRCITLKSFINRRYRLDLLT